jgi:hypothetical protein
MVNLDSVLSEISEFPLDEKEMIVDILKKRIIEEKRNLIFQDYQEALKDYQNGNVESGDVKDLFKAVEKL